MVRPEQERLDELTNKITQLQEQKRNLQKKKNEKEKKKRDHMLIVIGATFLSKFPEKNTEMLNAADEEISKWVRSVLEDPFP